MSRRDDNQASGKNSKGKAKSGNAANATKAEEVHMPMTGRRFHRRRGDIHEAEESSHIWLVSFTDVMALMLTFFVLLFSMTEPTKKDWSEITAAMNSEFNKFYGSLNNRGPQDSINIARINFDRALNINYLRSLLETVTGETELLEKVTLTPQPGRLVIALPHELLFDGGSATVRDEGRKALYALGGSLARIKNKIEIVGHADPRAITAADGAYSSNWELSLARAASVAAILESVGYEQEVTIRGNSSGRYDDLYGIEDEDKRLEFSRRVDIVVLDHGGVKQKVFYDTAPD